MNNILVIGAGKFGTHLAVNLCEMDNEVMLVDKDERRIDEISHQVTVTEIGDYTIKNNLKALGIQDFDYIFVCTSNFQDSLVIIDHLKELGASTIIAKASSEIHEKFLLKTGADKVIYPERDFAFTTAVEYSNRKIFDFRKLSDDTGIYEIEVPRKWIGKSLIELDVRKVHSIQVLAVKDGDRVVAITNPHEILKADNHIIVMGDKNDVAKITRK